MALLCGSDNSHYLPLTDANLLTSNNNVILSCLLRCVCATPPNDTLYWSDCAGQPSPCTTRGIGSSIKPGLFAHNPPPFTSNALPINRMRAVIQVGRLRYCQNVTHQENRQAEKVVLVPLVLLDDECITLWRTMHHCCGHSSECG